MNIALQKTFELLLIILLGILLQKKVPKKESLGGLKTIILSIALPATIFLALLKIKLDESLLVLPLMALCFNFLMFFAVRYLLDFSIPIHDENKKRTLNMLLPSLAPGLSCFPFIIAYLGDDFLALAALADVGNKIFGLIILYMLAMYWYRKRAEKSNASNKSKLKSLLLSLLNEPINMVIIIALLMLAFGFNITSFPEFLQNTIGRLSVIMVPLVLLFIGMAVRIKFSDFRYIFQMLTWRAGITFCISAVFIFLLPELSTGMMLLLIVFPQSSCSFWPFAHMSAVKGLEDKDGQDKPTFDLDFAVSILACSLPFSTLLIISVFYFGDYVANPMALIILGIAMILFSLIPKGIKAVKKKTKKPEWKNGIIKELELDE
ncbi:hypothetical protein GGR42_002142 [Saonia flava]|uniref:Permease n=1 Tax=Saonia flava TaxID=523696 RepID=A0A846QXK6_9FLAO|nr:permease [Saonia flava]NJB71680.1 hypothetical protein [Saonia flava]